MNDVRREAKRREQRRRKENPAFRRILEIEEYSKRKHVERDECFACNGDLDTGFECLDCGWDGRPYALNPDDAFAGGER